LQAAGQSKGDPKAEAPPSPKVEHEGDVNVVHVDHPEQFPLATAVGHVATSQLVATGAVSPDIPGPRQLSRSLRARVVEIHARLGDTVKKGQLLLRVQSADMSGAFADYRKAVADENSRVRSWSDHSCFTRRAQSSFERTASGSGTRKTRPRSDVENTTERIRVLGGDINHPAAIVEIRAPASGVITDQQVTSAAGVAGLSSPNPFTISDLSHVWILCDVYENDLAHVTSAKHRGPPERISRQGIHRAHQQRGVPYSTRSLRTAKVRIEVPNPGLMRIGMFVTATLHGPKKETRAAIPATAILHLHDRDWVYVPTGGNKFRRGGSRGQAAICQTKCKRSSQEFGLANRS